MFTSTAGAVRGWMGVAALAALLAVAPLAAEDAGTPPPGMPNQPAITEELYAKYLKLETVIETQDARMVNAKDDAARAEIQKAKDAGFTAAGIDAATYASMQHEILMINNMLMAEDMNPAVAEQMGRAFAMFPAVSVATVKAHHQAGAGAAGAMTTQASGGATGGTAPAGGNSGAAPGTDASTGAGATGGATGGMAAPAAGETAVDPTKIPGTWLVDMDATIAIAMPQLPPERRGMALGMINGHVHMTKCTFNADKSCVAIEANPDGSTTEKKGTWSFADGVLTIKPDDATQKDSVLAAAMRGELLMLGKDRGKLAFKRQ
ncbi:MAG: hypothetical protein ACREJ2_08305 [Planctomycetota bacterium]